MLPGDLAVLHRAPLLAVTHYCLLGEILGRAGPHACTEGRLGIELCRIDVNFLAIACLICLLSTSCNLTRLKNW